MVMYSIRCYGRLYYVTMYQKSRNTRSKLLPALYFVTTATASTDQLLTAKGVRRRYLKLPSFRIPLFITLSDPYRNLSKQYYRANIIHKKLFATNY